jgi:glutamine amidotransferase
VADKSYVYFCHSYYPQPASYQIAAAMTDYGSEFAAFIWDKNVYGVQFHPEKSQGVGLRMLKNFVELAV